MNIMTKRGSQDNVVTYEHYCDFKTDLDNIPQSQITLGSTAIVLQDEGGMGVYIAGSDKQWNMLSMSSGSSSGGEEDYTHNRIPVSESDVNFYDYDGTCVKAYTAADFANLSAMPNNPDHSDDAIPLTSQGWNWSLEDAQTYVAKYGRLNIGQMYITADGKTHIIIHIDADTPANRLMFFLFWRQSVAHGVTVDWGDGSDSQTFEDTSALIRPHTYTEGGDYHITLEVTAGTISFTGSSSTTGDFIGGSNANSNLHNRGRFRAVRFGEGLATYYEDHTNCFGGCTSLSTITIPRGITGIGGYMFNGCSRLRSFTIPDSVEYIGGYAFSGCSSLRSVAIPNGIPNILTVSFRDCNSLSFVTLPDSVKTIGDTTFSGCTSLINIIIPDEVTSIGRNIYYECSSLSTITIPNGITRIESSAFSSCPRLTSVTIPASVTYIGATAFAYNYGISEYHILSTTPPTLANKSAFTNIASDCVMYVPYSEDHSILKAYKAASNWSTYASKMQEEPQ